MDLNLMNGEKNAMAKFEKVEKNDGGKKYRETEIVVLKVVEPVCRALWKTLNYDSKTIFIEDKNIVQIFA